MRIALLAIITLYLSGCVSTETQLKIIHSQRTPSPAIKSAVIDYVRTTFFDPYSLRDAQISNVVTLPGTGLDAVCLRFNAKNSMGAYTGLKNHSLRLQGEAVVSSLADAPGCANDQMKYTSFPQLEAL